MTSGQPTSIYRQRRLDMGRRTPASARRGRSRGNTRPRRHRGGGGFYQLSSPDQCDLRQLASPENLQWAYRTLAREGGHAGGSDGLTFNDLSASEVWDACRALSGVVSDGTYRPQPVRTIAIPKGDGRFRTLSLQTVMDRALAKAVQMAVAPVLEQTIGKASDVYGIYTGIQTHIRQHSQYVLATDDIRDCFPSARIDDVLECFQEHIRQPDLLWLIATVLRGHDGHEHTTGLEQGSPLSPIAMELLLHTRLETPLDAEYPGYPLYRYVDNLTFLCNSTREARDLLQTTEQLLTRTSFSLKREDDPPADLRDHPRTVLGLSVGWESGQLTFTIPDKAYENLQEGFNNALTQPRPSDHLQSVAYGWINAVGPALTNARRPATLERVMDMARTCGARSLNRADLAKRAQQARLRWLEVSGQTTSTTGRR